ncbi:hypothetical protein G7Y89_g1569 [Cudoniella acicularis]|uniref:Uncharacterized protein n=1 Tax=Cudoniella acicularis TaxID=354080 RepID=A0A8H4RX00_9HELO|nr:hypothetical protein G7Y89_g1569 [Cudoniella acicularis]
MMLSLQNEHINKRLTAENQNVEAARFDLKRLQSRLIQLKSEERHFENKLGKKGASQAQSISKAKAAEALATENAQLKEKNRCLQESMGRMEHQMQGEIGKLREQITSRDVMEKEVRYELLLCQSLNEEFKARLGSANGHVGRLRNTIIKVNGEKDTLKLQLRHLHNNCTKLLTEIGNVKSFRNTKLTPGRKSGIAAIIQEILKPIRERLDSIKLESIVDMKPEEKEEDLYNA